MAKHLPLFVLVALLALTAACNDGGKTPAAQLINDDKIPTERYPTAPFKPTSVPLITVWTPQPPRPISEDGTIWGEVTAAASASVSPILRPASLPEGFETVDITSLGENGFTVLYQGQGKRLRITVGLTNPGPGGHQEQLNIRGIDCAARASDQKRHCPFLQVTEDANPRGLDYVMWSEAGSWEAIPGGAIRDAVEYLVSSEGLDPQELVAIVESMTPTQAPAASHP